jgi:hypothetical protein
LHKAGVDGKLLLESGGTLSNLILRRPRSGPRRILRKYVLLEHPSRPSLPLGCLRMRYE